MEVLIAMGIFTVGFVAVAAIFPSAILLQKRTIQNIESDQVAMNVKGLVGGRPYDAADLNAEFGNPPPVADQDRVLPANPGVANGVWDHWPLSQRVYLAEFAANGTPAEADYFWVPLFVYDSGGGSWTAYVFVLRRDPVADYPNDAPDIDDATAFPDTANANDGPTVPKVDLYRATNGSGLSFDLANAEDLLAPGDVLLIGEDPVSNATVRVVDGNRVTVNSVVPRGPFDVWLATPAEKGSPNPARAIVVIEGITP